MYEYEPEHFLIACLGMSLVILVSAIVASPDWDAIEEACAPVCMVDGVQHEYVRGRSSEEQCVCNMQRFVGLP
jgi:hypothetical protein